MINLLLCDSVAWIKQAIEREKEQKGEREKIKFGLYRFY